MDEKSYPSKETLELVKAILNLKTEKEAVSFLRDLLTLPEIKEFSNRFQMAKLLYEGNSYLTVARKLKVSTTTVTRVAHWLENGQNGYLTILKRLYPQS